MRENFTKVPSDNAKDSRKYREVLLDNPDEYRDKVNHKSKHGTGYAFKNDKLC
jgi:hypothetical protein